LDSVNKQKVEPVDNREELISSIPCGRILLFSHKLFKTDKPKFNVLLYQDINAEDEKEIYCMKINSKIPEFYFELGKHNDHVCITAKHYKFLSHAQSFINCMEILRIPISDIVSQYDTLFPRKDVKAKISIQTRDDILHVVERIDDIDTVTKNKVISGLKSIYIDDANP